MNSNRQDFAGKGKKRLFWDQEKPGEEQSAHFPEMHLPVRMPSEARLTEAEAQEEHLRLSEAIRQVVPATHNPFRWQRIAAAALILAAFVSVFLYRYFTPDRVTTAYGEIRTVWLPDSSQVILNANSVLTYRRQWQPGKVREVQLEGEAYFSVRKRTSAAGSGRFVVHSGGWNVEVLGTTFNVLNRTDKKQVVLATGKVRLGTGQGPDYTMLPGDLVEQAAGREIRRQKVNAADFIAWKNNEIVFREVPLAQIAGKISELYGVRVQITDSSRSGVLLTGTYPTNDLKILLEMIAGSAGLRVRQVENEVVFY
jgi:ferric-dicitrate binding protein FerR (iron transport regulator)